MGGLLWQGRQQPTGSVPDSHLKVLNYKQLTTSIDDHLLLIDRSIDGKSGDRNAAVDSSGRGDFNQNALSSPEKRRGRWMYVGRSVGGGAIQGKANSGICKRPPGQRQQLMNLTCEWRREDQITMESSISPLWWHTTEPDLIYLLPDLLHLCLHYYQMTIMIFSSPCGEQLTSRFLICRINHFAGQP